MEKKLHVEQLTIVSDGMVLSRAHAWIHFMNYDADSSLTYLCVSFLLNVNFIVQQNIRRLICGLILCHHEFQMITKQLHCIG